MVDCAAPCLAGVALRAGFFAGAGFAVLEVGLVSAGAGTAAGTGSSAGSTVSF